MGFEARIQYRLLRAHRALSKACLPLGQPPPQPFIVLARPRTGSNYLASMLDAHPNILMFGEKLRHAHPGAGRAWRSRLGSHRMPWVKATGLKLFYTHPESGDRDETWSELMADPNLRVIHLERHQWLDVIVSELRAEQTNEWVVRTDQRLSEHDLPKTFRLDPDWLRHQFEKMTEEKEISLSWIEGKRIQNLSYDALSQRPQAVMDQICAFLEVPTKPVRGYTQRQRHHRIDQIIENHAELVSVFAQSPWAKHFEYPDHTKLDKDVNSLR